MRVARLIVRCGSSLTYCLQDYYRCPRPVPSPPLRPSRDDENYTSRGSAAIFVSGAIKSWRDRLERVPRRRAPGPSKPGYSVVIDAGWSMKKREKCAKKGPLPSLAPRFFSLKWVSFLEAQLLPLTRKAPPGRLHRLQASLHRRTSEPAGADIAGRERTVGAVARTDHMMHRARVPPAAPRGDSSET
ncbi:hypothetical protein LX32DRAFT_278168 [Colletotrichum zoysiae]|uniref:Uncharacterized protein n=1 Tax=Colletotrichum zoysiae TaxID=1216348 RepID=A0AAD9H4B5_9PEZI|nr:hypothetical protein LX32DRAFT_278168 [Colletotrichum zoysiae]